jgi:hypothetical protein
MKATMTQFAMHPMRRLAWAWVAATLLALAPAAVAQHSAAAQNAQAASAAQQATVPAAKPAAKSVAAEETSAPNTPGNQGIRVHGHWVLQVKNPDGTLGERREFDNSLVSSTFSLGMINGGQLLTLLISGNAVAGDPGIAFITPNAVGMPTAPTEPCSVVAAEQRNGPGSCFGFTTANSPLLNNAAHTAESPTGAHSQLVFSQTGLAVAVNYSPSISWVLSGNYNVPAGLTSIAYVQTYLPVCLSNPLPSFYVSSGDAYVVSSSSNRSGNIAPASCDNTASTAVNAVFTSTAVSSGGVATPLTVTTGQLIAISVTITFS